MMENSAAKAMTDPLKTRHGNTKKERQKRLAEFRQGETAQTFPICKNSQKLKDKINFTVEEMFTGIRSQLQLVEKILFMSGTWLERLKILNHLSFSI